MNLSIIGTGYVGLVTGACFAKLGHTIICVDIDKEKINKINQGISPLYEKGLDQLLQENKTRIQATTDYQKAITESTITFICVGTPSQPDGDIDLSYIQTTAEQIGTQLKKKQHWHLVVVKSTVLPGTTKEIILPLLEKHSGKQARKDFGLATNPEFLREGVAVDDFLNPDRIIIGADDNQSTTILQDLYKNFTCPILTTTPSAAEMIKYASNALLATKISFINEIGNMCKQLGINTYDVADGIGLDKRLGRAFLDAGIGWGGSCFPKDVQALITWAKNHKQPPEILESIVTVNTQQPLRLIPLLKKHLPTIKGKTIGVLGLAFKPETDDIRESRSIPIVQELLKEGAHIKAYDPQAMNNFKQLFPQIHYCTSPKETLNTDAVLILTKWKEFTTLDYTGKIVIDGRKIDEATTAKTYEGVCW